MVASLVLRLAAGAASVMAAISAISLEVTVPGLGSCDPLRGQVHNAPGNPGDYKLVVLITGNNGYTWWDKMHGKYLLEYMQQGIPDPGIRQNAGIPVNADWSFSWSPWCSDPHDADADHMRFYLLPQSFVLTWPQYEIEGIPLALRLDVPNAAAAWVEINRQTLTVSDGGSNDNFINNPAPQPGAAPSPGPDTTGEDQPGASPTPATSANAGAASPTRSPARSPAADVHTSDATANTLLSSVAVVGAALAAVLAA